MAGIKVHSVNPPNSSEAKAVRLYRLQFLSAVLILFCFFLLFVIFIAVGSFKITALVALAFAGSIGMTLVILGCALPTYGVWWPFFVVLMYLLAPIPTIIARRYNEDVVSSSGGGRCQELSIFITMGFIVSAFALPIVLARAPANDPVIQTGACYLTLAGNVVVFLTLLGFFLTFDQEDTDYSMW